MTGALLLLVACSGGDPELAGHREAIAAWKMGKAALDAGRPADAVVAFREAQASRSDALLIGWEAHALARSGDLEGATERMADALAIAPPFAQGRYNRAAWLVQLGRPDEAGPELQRAITDGAARALHVLEDPDFADVLDHPAFSFLPRQAVSLALDAPPTTAFWGSDVQVRLRARGLVRAPLRIEVPPVSGPATLERAEEVWMPTSDPTPGVDWTWTLKVVGAGPIEIGPFVVHSGAHQAEVGAVRVEADAPPDKSPPEGPPARLLRPGSLAEQVAIDEARVVDDRLVVSGVTTDRVETTPPMRTPVRVEVHDADGVTRLFRLYAGPADHVKVVRAGEVVFDGPPR